MKWEWRWPANEWWGQLKQKRWLIFYDNVVEAWMFNTMKKGRQKSSDYIPFFEVWPLVATWISFLALYYPKT